MFDLFKRKQWQPDLVSEMKGTYEGLSVTVRNFSCLKDAASEARTYRYSNFGCEFIDGVHKNLGSYEELRNILRSGAGKTIIVNLPSLPAIQVSLSGLAPDSKRVFDSNLADALIAAFESEGIKP